jgi:uncharacterized membrane protein YagU involved in acid resistance
MTTQNKLAASALAGMLASVPMGLVMLGLERFLPGSPEFQLKRSRGLPGKRPLPPKEITAKILKRTGKQDLVSPGRKWETTTWIAHLGYGAASASTYPLLMSGLRLPPVFKGMLFALGVWALSYQGWLPSARILEPASEQPARRNSIMIVSHLVWGALLSLIETKVTKGEK